MATLTQTAYISRKIIKFGLLGLTALLILRSAFISFKAYWKKAHPPPPPAPTVAFGKLPKIKFPQKEGLPTIAYKQETVTGSLTKQVDRGMVFFIPKVATNLLAWDNAKIWAKKMGFTQEPEKVDDYTFRFVSETTPKTTLEMNVLTKNFHLKYDWENDLEIFSQGTPPLGNQAIALAKAFLQNANVLNEDLLQGNSEIAYLKYYSDGNLLTIPFSSEANFTRVNLFRSDIDGVKILPPDPKNANVSVILADQKSHNKGIMEVKFIYFPISLEHFATYPFKDINTAWADLIAGKGFVASLGTNTNGKVTIRNAYLAYFENEEQQSFLQPIFVFEGDKDFLAYVSAISDQWMEQ